MRPTFTRFEYWYLTMMYGVLVNEEYTLEVLTAMSAELRQISVMKNPSAKKYEETGLWRSYFGFVNILDSDTVSKRTFEYP